MIINSLFTKIAGVLRKAANVMRKQELVYVYLDGMARDVEVF